MKTKPIKRSFNATRAGRVRLDWVVVLVLLALAGAAVTYLALNRGPSDADDPNRVSPRPMTQQEIDTELGELQQSFQTALQEELDLNRLAAKARVFTERHPNESGGHVLLAQLRIGLNQWEEAYQSWLNAIEQQPGGVDLYKMAGFSAARTGRLEQALVHYQDAAKAANDQADCEVYAALGRLHLALEGPEAAEQMFKRSQNAPGVGEKTNWKHEAYAGLADVAAVRSEYDAALEHIDHAIKMARLDSEADIAGYRIQKARIYMDAGRDEDAVTMLGHTWSQHPAALWRIESARLRAKLYERAQQLDKAVDYVQSVCEWHRLAEESDNLVLADFTALLADWQIKAQRYDAARVSLHNLVTLFPKHPRIDALKERLP